MGFLAKLIVTYEDGTTATVVTDQTWASSLRGALREGDIYDGEIYDARLETDWSKPGLAGADSWNGVDVNTDFKGKIDPFTGGYVEVLSSLILHPSTVIIYEGSKSTGSDYGMVNTVSNTSGFQPFTLRKGQTAIVDFGQNMVGWVDFKVKGKAGVRMRQRFTEMLNDTGSKSRGNDGPGGSLYLANLRSAKAQLYYTLSGKADGEQYHPSTTFFGFRYLEITATDDIEVLSLEGQPVSSSTRDLGTVETSHADVNKLFSNIQWGQRGNLLSVPTDCPQRDERLGWTADTQVFSRTGMFNADMYSFYRKWMTDMRDGQGSDGAYPGIAPENWGTPFGQVGWADAGIFVPWNIYLMYGDKEVLRENFSSMERYMNFLATQVFDGYKYNGGGLTWGDWLSFASTDTRYISVAYYAQNAQIMARVCRA
ncbi:MAG: family 78 glycoside hydrolase catalytic domain, partial [Prevotella sp.]|nr:family 78 glycoside hydrolase catalytic domain [Prevotella sp.]